MWMSANTGVMLFHWKPEWSSFLLSYRPAKTDVIQRCGDPRLLLIQLVIHTVTDQLFVNITLMLNVTTGKACLNKLMRTILFCFHWNFLLFFFNPGALRPAETNPWVRTGQSKRSAPQNHAEMSSNNVTCVPHCSCVQQLSKLQSPAGEKSRAAEATW